MKKYGYILLLILALSSLSGCVSINEVDEDKVKDVSDKITEAIINTVGKEKADRQESHTVNAENLNTLNIKSSVGDINITTHESKDVLINLNITAQSSSKEKSKKLVDDFSYTVEENTNSIDVDTSFSDLAIGDDNVSTDLTITVPVNIQNVIISLNVGDINIKKTDGKFEVITNVGEINIENSQGSYNLKTNVGEIIVSSDAAIKNSEFITNTGDIILSFNDITNADIIKATTDVGDISVTVPENSSYEAVINEFMEKERTMSNGDKRTNIKFKTGVGSIEFN